MGAAATTAEQVRELLGTEFIHPTLWNDTYQAMVSDGMQSFVEVGPGDMLSKMARWIDRSTTCRPAGIARGRSGPCRIVSPAHEDSARDGRLPRHRARDRARARRGRTSRGRVVPAGRRRARRRPWREIRAAGGEAAAIGADVTKAAESPRPRGAGRLGVRRGRHPRQQRRRHQGRALSLHEGGGLGLRPRHGPEGSVPDHQGGHSRDAAQGMGPDRQRRLGVRHLGARRARRTIRRPRGA